MQRIEVRSGFIVLLQQERALGLKSGPNKGWTECLFNYKTSMSNTEQWAQ